MVGDEQIMKGVAFKMAEAEQRKEREPKLYWREFWRDSSSLRSDKNRQVGDSGLVQQGIERSL